jgi:hypothetical protein
MSLSIFRCGYNLSLTGFTKKKNIFMSYGICFSQLHPNGWVILAAFKRFLTFYEHIILSVSIFKTCYELIRRCIDGSMQRYYLASSLHFVAALIVNTFH